MIDRWEIQEETVPRLFPHGGKTTWTLEFLTKKNGALLKLHSVSTEELTYIYRDKYKAVDINTTVLVGYVPYRGEILRRIFLQRAFGAIACASPLNDLETVEASAHLSDTVGTGINMLNHKEESFFYSIKGWENLIATRKSSTAKGAI